MKYVFTKANLDKAIQEFSGNQNFIHNALPRLKSLYAIKKGFKTMSGLNWFFEYDHVNINNNRVSIHFQNHISSNFNFFYEIPLSLSFELRVFLSNSTVHFLDLYNFLIEKEIICKDQFPIKAEYHTIPHFVVNSKIKRYDMRIISKHSIPEELNEDFVDEKVKNEIQNGFTTFNPIFEKIINQF